MTETIIVLLGSPNRDDGTLYDIAQDRCERAIVEWQQHPGAKILPTGGFGDHFNTTNQPHAAYLRAYLHDRGVPPEDVIEGAHSRNSLEDATLSFPIFQHYGASRAIVVTSDYHSARAQYIFGRTYKGIELTFALCPTDEATCAVDLPAQVAHEREALAKLKSQDRELDNLAIVG